MTFDGVVCCKYDDGVRVLIVCNVKAQIPR